MEPNDVHRRTAFRALLRKLGGRADALKNECENVENFVIPLC